MLWVSSPWSPRSSPVCGDHQQAAVPPTRARQAVEEPAGLGVHRADLGLVAVATRRLELRDGGHEGAVGVEEVQPEATGASVGTVESQCRAASVVSTPAR